MRPTAAQSMGLSNAIVPTFDSEGIGMKTNLCLSVATVVAGLVMTFGVAGSASAGAGTTFCGYQETGGAQQWERRYVGNRQCPANDVYNGAEGHLIYSEYIA